DASSRDAPPAGRRAVRKMAELWLNAAAGPRGIGSAASSNSTSMAETILVVTRPSFVRRNAAVVVAGPVGLRMAVIAQITVVLVGRAQKTIPEVIVVAIVKAIAVVVCFATRRPITVGINRTAKREPCRRHCYRLAPWSPQRRH